MFFQETGQIGFRGAVVARQIGRFGRAEQRGRRVSPLGLAAGIGLELPPGLIEFAQLPQRLAEVEDALVCPALVGIRGQEGLELLNGEFPVLVAVVACRDGKLVVGLAGPCALSAASTAQAIMASVRIRPAAVNMAKLMEIREKGQRRQRNKPQWPGSHRGLLQLRFVTAEGG